MDKKLKIAVLGATGKVGSHFVKQALDKGYALQVLVRSESKFKYNKNNNISVVVGNSTNLKDVEKVMTEVDYVVSCLGNVKTNKKYIHIMKDSHTNILDIAAKQNKIPRCIFISSIGCGGSSWLIKAMLIMIGGKDGFNDYEAADKQIREQSIVPSILVRPYALIDNPATGLYKIIKKQTTHFAKPISRTDLASCLVDIIKNNFSNDKTVIHVGGV